MRGEGRQGLAGMLGGRDRQHEIAVAERGQVMGGLDGVVQAHARQVAGIFAQGLDLGGHLGLARPEPRRQSRKGRDLGQGRAPGPRVDHPHRAHQAFAPLRPGAWVGRSAAAASSSGQRGRAAASSPLVKPALSRSAPANAIMAALSVQ